MYLDLLMKMWILVCCWYNYWK